MASACLPTLFQAVEIDGHAYWDGGYMGNPALFPLFDGMASEDVLLVQINPGAAAGRALGGLSEIMDRLNEITFNATLLREMRAIAFVKRLIREGKLDPRDYKDVRMHRIDGAEALAAYPAGTKLSSDWRTLKALHDIGRAAATGLAGGELRRARRRVRRSIWRGSSCEGDSAGRFAARIVPAHFTRRWLSSSGRSGLRGSRPLSPWGEGQGEGDHRRSDRTASHPPHPPFGHLLPKGRREQGKLIHYLQR